MYTYSRRQIFTASLVYLGQMSVGYGLGWSAPIIPILQDPEKSPLPDVITDEQSSWVGSLLFVGAITGPYISSYISKAKGRIPCLFFGTAIANISYVMTAFAKNIGVIYAARILMGFGNSIIFVTNLVYVGEIASTNIRGTLLSILAIFLTFGTNLAYSVGPYVSYAVICWLGLVLSASFTVAIIFLPESPIHQMLNEKENEAKNNLKSLGRENDIEMVKAVVKNITMASIVKDSIEIFTIKCNRKALFITVSLHFFQQTSGILAVTVFATTIFELAGSSIEPHVATIIIGFTMLGSSALVPFFVEGTGRKFIILISSGLTSLSTAILGVYFFLERIEHPSVRTLGWLPLLCLMSFCISFDFGLGVIPGIFVGEMFRANVRSIGSSITCSIGWAAAFGVTTAFGYMVPALGPDFTFWIFSLCTAFSFIFIVFLVPETKGKTFIEIEEMLSR